ncbi:hypothetical protein [Salipaludibacillus keqinensis]|uniref:hypothetical protein n=1 Tax=Salipaludibacillus keqinensis TaxID=2045207 RepID=UPI001304AB16|nr:hypothetical protein [Salipaludibacillus keqinensis]
MRAGYNHEQKGLSGNPLLQPDLHRFVEAERSTYGSSPEIGLSTREVRSLKRQVERN